MPVTFVVNPKKRPDEQLSTFINSKSKESVKEYINSACQDQAKRCKEILQSSFSEKSDLKNMSRIGTNLVNVAIEAYNRHYHLVLRLVHKSSSFRRISKWRIGPMIFGFLFLHS